MLEEIEEEQLVFFAVFCFHKTLSDFEHTVTLAG